MKINNQPIIGITMAMDDYDLIIPGAEHSFIRQEYGQEVAAAGGQPIYLDKNVDPEAAAELCDGIVISGGHDIWPEVYGQERLGEHPMEPKRRTEWEMQLIEACDKKGVPILGICYGMQLLNVYYGGTLYQDIATEQGTTTDHGSPYESIMQRAKFHNDFLSFQKGDNVQTAHRHHQAVRELGRGFEVAAMTEDGLVEAIVGNGHHGIQWHAEVDGTAPTIYGAFVALCAGEPAEELSFDPVPEAA